MDLILSERRGAGGVRALVDGDAAEIEVDAKLHAVLPAERTDELDGEVLATVQVGWPPSPRS